MISTIINFLKKIAAWLGIKLNHMFCVWALALLILVPLCLWFFWPAFVVKGHYQLRPLLLLLTISLFLIGGCLLHWRSYRDYLQGKDQKQDAKLEMNEAEKAEEEEAVKQSKALKLQDGHWLKSLREQYFNIKQIEKNRATKKLPGYILLGRPGAGRSTLLNNSGMQFPLQNQLSALSACQQWWFANEGVFLEVDLTQDSQRNANLWQSNLNLLSRVGSIQRWKGLVVAISVAELFNLTEDELTAYGQGLRNYIQLIETTLARELPVHIIITQSDQIIGFSEFTQGLDEGQASQPWGMFFDNITADKVQDTVRERFEDKFTDMLHRLQTHMLPRLQQQQDTEQRLKLYQLPDNMKKIADRLKYVLEGAFVLDYYQTSLPLRSVFFTGVCQVEEKSGRMLLESQTRVDESNSGLIRHNEVKKYISRGYFIDVVFKYLLGDETKLAKPSYRRRKQLKWLRGVCYAFGGAFVTFVSASIINSYIVNHRQLEQLNVSISNYKQMDAVKKRSISDNLSRLYSAMNLTNFFSKDNRSLSNSWGLYLNGKLQQSTNEYYTTLMNGILMPQLQSAIANLLKTEQGANLYQALAAYLMLGNTSYRNDRTLLHWVGRNWGKLANANPELPANLNNVQPLLKRYLQVSSYGLNTDTYLIASARNRLKGIASKELNYYNFALNAIGDYPDAMNFYSDEYSPYYKEVFSNVQDHAIPTFYTHKGLRELFVPFVSSPGKYYYDWVLDRNRNGQKQQFLSEDKTIWDLYINNYLDTWTTRLNAIQIGKFIDLNHAAQMIKLLGSDQHSPIKAALVTLSKNLDIFDRKNPFDENSLPLKIKQKYQSLQQLSHLLIKNKDSKNQSTYDQINTQLLALYTYLQKINNADNPNKAAYMAAKQLMSSPVDTSVLGSLYQLSKNVPEPVSDWLNSIVVQTWSMMLDDSVKYLNGVWRQQVYSFYANHLAGRYPIDNKSLQSVSLDDFSAFFAAQGKLLSYYNTYLQPFVNDQQKQWSVKKHYGVGLGLSNNTVRQLSVAQRLSQSLFVKGSNVPLVNFIITPYYLSPDVLSAKLSYEGNSIEYRHGMPLDYNLKWLGGDNDDDIISVSMYKDQYKWNTMKQGTWSLLQLFDEGHLHYSPLDHAYFMTLKDQDGDKVTYKVAVKKPVDLGVTLQLKWFNLSNHL